MELRQEGGIGRERFRQQFQRDRLTELEIVGAIDLAHAAAADERDDPEAAREDDAGIEAGQHRVGLAVHRVRDVPARTVSAGEPGEVVIHRGTGS